jgi:hypothetical protein
MRRSGRTGGVTVITIVAVLLLVSASITFPVTEAVLESVPAVVGVTTIITVALFPLDNMLKLQVTVLVPLQAPWLGVAETKVTPPGKVSVIVTPAAASGPLFIMVIV